LKQLHLEISSEDNETCLEAEDQQFKTLVKEVTLHRNSRTHFLGDGLPDYVRSCWLYIAHIHD